ncbi:MAG: hypothetical protein IJ207_12945 [Treponema sp.]|uniref:hypothetical protein n=1 Tax=Treponema sp. TaxID=166 RepID=UPI0025F364A5|nr:hypothetical protein [Treponema sp.]MBQ9283078.1 hypothetical protein [Treponema sp.]
MIIYEAVSTYHLLRALLHCKKNKKDSILLIAQIRIHLLGEELKKYLNENFLKVISYDISYANKKNDKAVKKYFQSLLGNIKKYETIYCGCPHFAFGYYLSITNTPFVFCEDAAGILTRPEIIKNLNDEIELRKEFNKKCIEHGLYDGNNKNIVNYFCNLTAQCDLKNIPKEKIVDFDVVKELSLLPELERKELISAFIGDIKINCPKDSSVILTQYFTGHQILTFEAQILVYQLVVDYFFSDVKLVFKPHPDDILYYKKLFPQSEVIRQVFPSEFIPFIFDPKPKCVATVSSTGIYNLRGHFEECFELDVDFEKRFPFIHRYYAAFRIYDALKMNVNKIGCNDILLEQFENKYGASTEKQNTACVIDDIKSEEEEDRNKIISLLDNLNPNDCAIFINSTGDFCWYDYFRKDLWQNIVPVVIQKSVINPKKEDFYASPDEEVIYVYSKNKEILNMAKEIHIEKDLTNTNLKVTTAELSHEQERIKILEGMLAATERRLLLYINKENETEK